MTKLQKQTRIENYTIFRLRGIRGQLISIINLPELNSCFHFDDVKKMVDETYRLIDRIKATQQKRK